MAKELKSRPKVQLQSMEVISLPIDAVVPNEYNPNRQSDHEFEMLCKSIEEDGFTQPIVVLKNTVNDNGEEKHRIVDGEHRWRAVQTLGYKTIDAVMVDMDEAQRRISTLRHNLARGSHDVELSAAVIQDLEQLGQLDWAQEALQLTDVEIQRMLENTTPLDAFAVDGFSESWDYTGADVVGEDGVDSVTQTARSIAHIKGDKLERERQLMQMGMAAEDADIVRSHITTTRDQSSSIQKVISAGGADALVAIAEAHTEAKTRSGRGEWTTLTFVVPTEALKVIEDEIDRLRSYAPNRNPDLTPELQRGLALEYAMVLSSQTPDESLR